MEHETLRYEHLHEKPLAIRSSEFLGLYYLLLYNVCCAAYSERDYQVISDVTLNLGVSALAVLHEQFPFLREFPNQSSSTLLFVSLKDSG